jgi:Lrp/AsnC family transcriptional regulator for asnA, asnC and gidA
VDQTDLSIIQHLQRNGRKPYTEIAQELGVSEATVRSRVSRLVDDQVLQIVGMVDPHHLGFSASAVINVSVQPGRLETVAGELAACQEVSYLVMISGEFDLLVEVMCRDNDHFVDFLNQKLLCLPGVQRTQTSFILRTFKLSYAARPTKSPLEGDGP